MNRLVQLKKKKKIHLGHLLFTDGEFNRCLEWLISIYEKGMIKYD